MSRGPVPKSDRKEKLSILSAAMASVRGSNLFLLVIMGLVVSAGATDSLSGRKILQVRLLPLIC